MMPIIYIDLDGVLFDLDRGLRDYYQLDHSIADRSELFKSYLPGYVHGGGFRFQPVMPKAYDLVNYLIALRNAGRANLAILTSAGQFFDPVSEVINQKAEAVADKFPQLKGIPFCVTTSGADKCYLAHPKAFLIDDWHKNITHFCNANGQGIVYSPEKYAAAILAIKDFVNAS